MMGVSAGIRPSARRAAQRVKAKRSSAQRDPLLDDPFQFATRYLKIRTKRGDMVPLVYNRSQLHYLTNRTPRDLILKARQQGFSTAIQAEFTRIRLAGTAVTVTLSNVSDNTQVLRRMSDRFHEHLPPHLQAIRESSSAVLSLYPATHSESMIATAGSKNIGRGASPTHIHASEIAFYTDADAIERGLMQGGNPAWIVKESTPNGAQGHFYELCMEVLDGQRDDWRLHFYPWWWSDEYRLPLPSGETLTYDDEEKHLVHLHNLLPEQIVWRRQKKRELGRDFSQEYPEDARTCFLLSGEGYFGNITSAMLSAPLEPDPVHNHRYAAGLDLGQMTDYTALSIMDATAGVEVAQLRLNRQPWRSIRHAVIAKCRQWGVTTLIIEKNASEANIEEFVRELRDAELTIRIGLFTTSNATKVDIASSLREALETDKLRLQDTPIWTRELRAFQAFRLPGGGWRLEAMSKEHDDTVIARCLAWRAATMPPSESIIVKGLG